ncbi:MAG: chromosome segregation protein SMC [Thermodesulfovibrionales bacterium]
MYIEKIELIGFKSFAEKTTFNLHHGITCIVGPNGAGKSNIVDSFRWVLGEQSAKSLRGEKMEEVIFNGSATKKPRGMSEVNLVLSFDSPEQGNGDSQSLTSVTRRLYRSGDSEYLINRDQCRLKDIRDLFLDTGLEVKSYSILEQGRISEIISSKPHERRFLIEEVAGVMKYKVRRAEAQSKLESSRLNLQRINDIIVEVRRQINALDRQVKKAERFKRLSAELRAIELKMAKRDYSILQESLGKILKDYSDLKEEAAVVRAELNRVENAIETRRIGLLDKEKSLESLTSELQGLEKEIAETERIIAVSTTEGNNLKEYLEKLSQQEIDIIQRIAGIENKKMELDSAVADLSSEIDNLRQELTEKNESIRDMENEFSEKEAIIEAKRRDIFRIAEEMSSIRNEIGRLAASMDNLDKKGASALKEAETAQKQLQEIESSIQDADATLIGKNNELFLLNEKKGKFTADIEEYRSRLDDVRERIAKQREELASASSRLDSLREIMHEDFSMEVLSENLQIMASIAEIIDVDEAYEKAIENALSEKVKGFILPTVEDITAAVPILKQKGITRTVFIPLDLVTEESVRQKNKSYMTNKTYGRAVDFVRIQKEVFLPVLESLLNNVFIVKDIFTAFSLLKDSRATYVTLDGEIVEPSGIVTVGEGKGILKRQREVRELDALIGQRKIEIKHLEEMMADIEASLQDRTASLKDIESTIIDTEKEISLMRLTVEKQMEEKERISRRLAYLNIEREEAIKERESIKGIVAEKETEVERINTRKIDAEQMVSRMQDALSKNRERYEAERSLITELRLNLNSSKERIEAVRKEIEASVNMLADLSRTKDLLIEEKSNVGSRIDQCREDVSKNNDVLKGLVLKADSLRTAIADNREVIRSESEELIRSEHELKALRNRLDSLTARIAEADVSIAEHRLRLENLTAGIRQNYGIEIDSFVAEPLIPEEEERLSEIRSKIQELGPVNLGTLEEYEELRNRYEFLTGQQEDLNKSIAELEEAITRINSTTRKKLREAFVDLNTKFSDVFTYLFGGGKAELILTDENNILDSGIEIIAQPPGKRFQNINLLSGGEKTLTALSLLFASFLIKPSPLCILDEVDAALDEANVERFARMLRELSDRIQFIVITHNRITMESADYIYGITMEEPGVSKVISMQFADSQTAG